jgi:hypothetical protein
MSNTENIAAPETRQVRAASIRRLRLMHANERPGDAIIEITTGNGTQHFLIARAALPQLAAKLAAFDGKAVSRTNQELGTDWRLP